MMTSRRPLRGLTNRWLMFPGVHCAHPGLYAWVRCADSEIFYCRDHAQDACVTLRFADEPARNFFGQKLSRQVDIKCEEGANGISRREVIFIRAIVVNDQNLPPDR